ncbi:patatin-like phospholipase family protein [uncultured Pseudacidovorax sp.]|uniref:patatin-like phospholipase family protein n=1 Tax=uncultured Pseudacidovorax sp. TaxID=679313 RepID=UPI0025E19CF0|nr:patatin-like phospholipase family protein [uncultured Pseudacidovorax sp.]
MDPHHPTPAATALDLAVAERRAALAQSAHAFPDRGLPSPAVADPLLGLALSGGGIRSATFCLGVLRSLAANRLLLRFDLLSTVSGGGYIGGMLGRLFDRGSSPDHLTRVNQALAQAESTHFGWWLRASGRYLTPAGAADTLFALALYLRNLVGIHVEFGVIAVLVAGMLCGIDLLAWQGVALTGNQLPSVFDWIEWLHPSMPTL